MNYLFTKKKYFFGDIEIVSNKNYSLFNIKANEDNSIVCIMDKRRWCGIIRKIREKFNRIVSNKMDILHERIQDILLKKKNMKFDKLKLNQEKIFYQLLVNNNFSICNKKINSIIEHKNKMIQKYNKKHKKRLYINNKLINDYKDPNIIRKSKSLLNIKTCQEKVMDLFKFPVILKNETKSNFTNFFDKFYIKKDKKRVRLSETKIDSEPLYINRFRNIYNLNPQQKHKFLNIVKNYLNKNYSKENPISNSSNKSNIQELFTMYNYYVNNSHEITYNSTNNNMLKTSAILNNSLKNNFRKNNSVYYNIKTNNSCFQNQINNSLKLESKKNLNFGNLKINNNFNKNKIKMKKIKFNNQITNYSNKKNFDNITRNSNLNKFNKFRNNNSIKFDEITPLNNKKKRLTIYSSSNNKIFKNEKITTKTIFDALLKNKCELVKSQMLENIGGEKINKNSFLKININNNIDLRDENYIKNIFFANKFTRANSFNEFKFK